MVQRKVLYVILWHVSFMLLYLIGAFALHRAEDFSHLNVHLLNICALCTIIMVLSYQFIITASFYGRTHYRHKAVWVNFGVILLLYILYLLFYSWLFIDYLRNREEHLYYGLRDLNHLFEVKESILHYGFFTLMIYSSVMYFTNLFLVYGRIKKMSSAMQRKAYYKVYYNPLLTSLIISSILGILSYFILHVQGMFL